MNMQEIAKLAKVSATTVSKVINGKDKDISPETRARVLRIVEEEQYVPYAKFRATDDTKSHVIGLVLRANHPQGEAILYAAEQAAKNRGYSLMVSHYHGEEELERTILELAQRRAAGLLVDTADWKPHRRLEETTVYLADTKSFHPSQKVSYYYRLSDAGRLAVQRLRQEGHEKIGCVTLHTQGAIEKGYRTAMNEENLHPRPLWMYQGETLADIQRYGIQQCLRANVTAILCGSWEIAFLLCRSLEKIGIAVPGDISVLSVGKSQSLELLDKSVTAVELPIPELCQSSVSFLLDMLEKGKSVQSTRKFLPHIVEGNTLVPPRKVKVGSRLAVVGSMNMDTTFKLAYLPVNNETQPVERVFEFPGGKGANQAVGVSRLGALVSVIGCLGDDIEGRQIYSSLVENNVQVQGIRIDPETGTGRAHINLDRTGESSIVVYQGANQKLDISHINQYHQILQEAKLCLITSEIRIEVVQHTAMLCRKNGTQVLYKPLVTDKISDELLQNINYLIPNENEINFLLPGPQSLEEKAAYFLEKGAENVIVTLAERGCYLKNAHHSLYIHGSGFAAVDTTGGADSFISALAVYLSEGEDLIKAILFAIYASGITITRYGVQTILPERQEVDVYEDEINRRYQKILQEEGLSQS